jgi:hypothetical protein
MSCHCWFVPPEPGHSMTAAPLAVNAQIFELFGENIVKVYCEMIEICIHIGTSYVLLEKKERAY